MFEKRYFFLGKNIESAVFSLFSRVFKRFTRFFNGLEVGQHAAEPTFVDEEHAATFQLRS